MQNYDVDTRVYFRNLRNCTKIQTLHLNIDATTVAIGCRSINLILNFLTQLASLSLPNWKKVSLRTGADYQNVDLSLFHDRFRENLFGCNRPKTTRPVCLCAFYKLEAHHRQKSQFWAECSIWDAAQSGIDCYSTRTIFLSVGIVFSFVPNSFRVSKVLGCCFSIDWPYLTKQSTFRQAKQAIENNAGQHSVASDFRQQKGIVGCEISKWWRHDASRGSSWDAGKLTTLPTQREFIGLHLDLLHFRKYFDTWWLWKLKSWYTYLTYLLKWILNNLVVLSYIGMV